MTVLKVADEGKWVRLMSAKGHYAHNVSKKTFEQTPPRYSARTFKNWSTSRFRRSRSSPASITRSGTLLENGSEK